MLDVRKPSRRAAGLSGDEVHVWSADLGVSSSRLATLERYLSADELARAARFHFQRDRESFICARGLLRELLAGYCDRDPRSLRFSYSQFGKPELVDASPDMPGFNYSRSAGRGLFAFAHGRPIGVDIEQIVDDVEFMSIALQHYSHAERDVLAALESSARITEFFRCWTRREAFSKATGQGLGQIAQEFNALPSVIYSPSARGVEQWRLETLDLIPQYACAIAAPGADVMLTVLEVGELGAADAVFRNAG